MFSIKNILKESYSFYLSKFTTLVGITALVYFLSSLFEHVAEEIFFYTLIGGIVFAVFFGVIALIIEIGYVKYLLKLVSGGTPVIEDLLKHSYLFWRYLFGGLLLALVVAVGLVFLIVPGIYLALRFMFVPILIVDKNIGIKDAFKKSTELTQGAKWKLLGLAIVLALIHGLLNALLFSNAGPVVYGAGFVLVSPYVAIAAIKTYRALQGLD